MPWAMERADPAHAAGIRIGGDPQGRLAHDAIRFRERLLGLGLTGAVEVSTSTGRLRARIHPEVAARWAPGHDTTGLAARLPQVGDGRELARETLVALLLAPEGVEFPSLAELLSAVRMRLDMVAIARDATLAFDCDERRPRTYWRRDAEGRFLLRRGHCLMAALERAVRPAVGEAPYAFGCYRATEYVMLLAIAREAARCHPALLAALRERSERRPSQSREFHETLLREHGTTESPLPARWFVPGDRVWFRNPDERSADAEGFEGSWVVYLGGGLFANFWERDRPFTLERKCVEIHHWRHCVVTDASGALRIDEDEVDRLAARTFADPDALAVVLDRMQRWRDVRGVYADGGCLDRTRESPLFVRPGTCDIEVRPD